MLGVPKKALRAIEALIVKAQLKNILATDKHG
jgi:hypothetical protein